MGYGVSVKDLYSNFGFYDAFTPVIASDAQGTESGPTLDLRGFGGAVIVACCDSYASAGAQGAADITYFKLQHGLASAAGVSAWSLVPNSQLIHSCYGGYTSTGETGIWASFMSKTEVSAQSVHMVGYKGDYLHRYLRMQVVNSDAASAMYVGANAIMGLPGEWPVNTPV